MDNTHQKPGLVLFLKYKPQAPPVHTAILGIYLGEMVFDENTLGIEIVNVVDGISGPDYFIEANHFRMGEVHIIDKPVVVFGEGHLDRFA